NRFWIQCLLCCLLCCTLLGGHAAAQEPSWRSAGATGARAADAGAADAAGSRSASVSLGRPEPAQQLLPSLPAGKYRGKVMDDPPARTRADLGRPYFDIVPSDDPPSRPISSALSADFLPPVGVVEPLVERGWILVDYRGNPILESSEGWLPPQRLYPRAEYLYWWTRGQRIPPLVTTAPATTPEDVRGALGAPGTQILFGGDRLDALGQSGGRFTGGYWLDDCCQWALEGGYFF